MMFRQNLKSSSKNYNSKQCLVLEMGTYSIKAGFAGQKKPSYLEPTVSPY
jgi:actin-related protein